MRLEGHAGPLAEILEVFKEIWITGKPGFVPQNPSASPHVQKSSSVLDWYRFF